MTPTPDTVQRIADEMDALCAKYDSIGGGHAAMPIRAFVQRLRTLSPAADAERLDAERYRWLRHGDNDEHVLRCIDDKGGARHFDYKIDGCWLPRNAELDAAIDTARKATP